MSSEEMARIRDLVKKAYEKTWTQAKYDPDNAQTREFARSILPFLYEANRILGGMILSSPDKEEVGDEPE